MKKQNTFLAWRTSVLPMLLMAVFVLFNPVRSWADPVAIGTGTVTLNYANTSDPAAPASNTYSNAAIGSGETCIAFGNTAWDGSIVYSKAEWSVTIVPGVYDVAVTYGTGSWGTTPLFSLYNGESKVMDVFQAPGDRTSGAWATAAGWDGSVNNLNLSGLNGSTTYTLRVVETWASAYGTCIGHISFTRKADGSSTSVFGQEADGGATTLPSNGSNTINNVTVSTNITLDFCASRTYDYIFGTDYTDYADISVDNSLKITGVATSILYDGAGSGNLYIQFCSTDSYDPAHKVGDPIVLSGLDFSTFYTYPPSTSDVSVPAGTIKSARIYKVGTREWGMRLYRIAVSTAEDVCASPLTVSFVKAGSESGSVPNDIDACAGEGFTMPGQGTLAYAGHKFTGWYDGTNTYAAGASYTMGEDDVVFTAVWEEIVVPVVTNLAINSPLNSNIPLSWNIPGKLDLNTATTSVSGYFINGQSAAGSYSYNSSTEELTVTYTASQWAQPGVAFPFTLSNLESVTFEYKGHRVFPEVVKADGTASYWDYDVIETAADWTKVTRTPIHTYSGSVSAAPLPAAKAITFCANPNANKTNESFYLRNVFYHVKNQVDIGHVVLMRKAGSAAADTTDAAATKLYSGKLSHFTDDESKTIGTTYYYTVFAVDKDGNMSAGVTVSKTITDDTPHSVTYAKGGEDVTGSVPADASTYLEGANVTVTAKGNLAWSGHAFMGWSDGTAIYGAGSSYPMPNHDVTLTAQWVEISLHEPGKYQAPTSEGGYGRVLKNNNSHDYEVYMMTFDEEGRGCTSSCSGNYVGELYAGSVTNIHDGYKMFSGSNGNEVLSNDGWVAFKPYKYYGGDGSCNIDEFKKLDGSGSIHSARYARLSSNHYVRLYVQGYVEFALCCKDKKTDGTDNIVIRIDGVTQAYAPSTSMQVVRYTLTSNEPHFIEITGNSSESKEDNVYGFSLQLPDVERYTVTVAKNDNSYGTVSAASIANVRTGSPVYVNDNTVYIAGTTIEATPTESNAQYTYAFNNWTVGGAAVPATITAATTITANFTRTAEEYTLTWDLDGGTVTTAGTGAAVDATGTPSTTVAFGEAITAPVVEKDGYRFLGWDVTPAATMPAENVTYTAQWAEPIIIGSGATLDVTNVYSSPGTAYFNVDGEGEEELCLDLKNQNKADWWVKMTPGSYKVSVKYGTSSGGVKVRIQIIDAETGTPITETEKDEHTTGTLFIATWSMDLGELINADKTYYIRVKDAYGSNGSTPKVGSVEVTPIEPETITNTATKRLDYDNVAVPYQIMPFDIENDGSNETCLFIGDNHKAEWKATITPDVYNIHVYYGKPSAGTKLKTYILDKNNDTVWVSSVRTTPSGRYETWEIKSVDLFGSVDKDEVYTIGIKDVYPGTGSKPYIGYIDFIPAVVKIPAETRLDATNTYSTVSIKTDVNFDDDALTTDNSMNLNGTQADYVVQIQPGYYNVSLAYGAPEYSVRVAVTLTDPTGAEEERYLSTNPYYYESGSEGVEHHHISSMKCDLTGLDGNKSYRLHIKDMYGSSNNLRVNYLEFSPIEPMLIANNTILNSTNTVTFNAPTQEFNVDGVEGNETCLLVSQHYGVSPVEWSVNVTPGVYDLNVHFGNNAASDGGYDMTIYLVDPETPESPVSLYHKRVSDGTSLSYGVARCDFSGLAADKDYIIRVVDNWDGSKLRVGDIKFVTPAPLQIPSVTRLNASNVYVTPHYGKQNFNIEGEGEIECLNIRYQGEAAWFANLTPYVYNITVKYGKASAGSKVRFGIIKVSTGDTIFVQQDDKGAVTEPTTYTAQANLVDLRSSITAGDLCKIFVKDNYPSLGSEPRVAYIDIARATINHTRTGLRVGDFGTVCLPYGIAAADRTGAELFEIDEWDASGTSITLTQLNADEDMVAGRPYIYQATASTATFRYYPEGDEAVAGQHNGLIGSYTQEVITQNDNNYIIYNNKLYLVNSLAYVGANRAYIHRTVTTPSSAPRRRVTLMVNGTQTATGLENVTGNQTPVAGKIIRDGQLFIIRDGKTYNAQGCLISK